jgi:hypothetical protein
MAAMRNWMARFGMLGALVGCTSSAPADAPRVVRSCSDPWVDGAPCEGSFSCNFDCRTAPDGRGAVCSGGRLHVGDNDCGLRRDASVDAPWALDCAFPYVEGHPCSGLFHCNECPAEGEVAYHCLGNRLTPEPARCPDAP